MYVVWLRVLVDSCAYQTHMWVWKDSSSIPPRHSLALSQNMLLPLPNFHTIASEPRVVWRNLRFGVLWPKSHLFLGPKGDDGIKKMAIRLVRWLDGEDDPDTYYQHAKQLLILFLYCVLLQKRCNNSSKLDRPSRPWPLTLGLLGSTSQRRCAMTWRPHKWWTSQREAESRQADPKVKWMDDMIWYVSKPF